jgi:hypothetical protein
MHIEMLEVVRGGLVPFCRVIRHVVCIADDRWLAVLRARRSVEIVTIEPDTSSVEDFSCLPLVSRLLFDRDM